jgi:hypothetical protein
VSVKYETVVGFALKGVDTPREGGGHDEEPDWYRIVGLQPVGKGRLPTLEKVAKRSQ